MAGRLLVNEPLIVASHLGRRTKLRLVVLRGSWRGRRYTRQNVLRVLTRNGVVQGDGMDGMHDHGPDDKGPDTSGGGDGMG